MQNGCTFHTVVRNGGRPLIPYVGKGWSRVSLSPYMEIIVVLRGYPEEHVNMPLNPYMETKAIMRPVFMRIWACLSTLFPYMDTE